MVNFYTFQSFKESIMYKKLFGIALLSILGAGSLLAVANDSVLKFVGACADKHIVMTMMGELSLHFAGEMNCVESIQFKG